MKKSFLLFFAALLTIGAVAYEAQLKDRKAREARATEHRMLQSLFDCDSPEKGVCSADMIWLSPDFERDRIAPYCWDGWYKEYEGYNDLDSCLKVRVRNIEQAQASMKAKYLRAFQSAYPDRVVETWSVHKEMYGSGQIGEFPRIQYRVEQNPILR